MADIGISIRVSADGTVTVKKNLDAIGQSAEKAMGSADKLDKSLNSLKAPSLKTVANDFNSIGAAAVANTNRISSATAMFGQFGRSAQTAANEGRTAMSSFGAVVERVKTSLAGFGSNIGAGVQNAISQIGRLRAAMTTVRPTITAVGQSSQVAALNTANLAAQFNDIGVTAAMMQSPLQIALQQGTQISQVFGGMGAAGAVKALGAAFVSIISPISLLTIGVVAGVAAFIQYVNWSKVMVVALDGLIKGIKLFVDNIDTLRPLLIGAAAAMLAAFGPAMLAAVVGLTKAVGVGLYTAVANLFKLIMRNPLVAAFTAVVTAVSFLIEKTIGWQAALERVLVVIGKIVEGFGTLLQSDWITSKGMEIQINAKQAAADLLNAGSRMGDTLVKSITNGAKSLKESLEAGATVGADKLKKSFEAGAGALAKAADTSITAAGDKAGRNMGGAIQSAGNAVTQNMSSAMADVLAGFRAFGGDLIRAMDQAQSVIRAQIGLLNAQAANLRAQAAKANQEAMSIRAERNGSGGGGGSGSGGALNNWHHPAPRKQYVSEVRTAGFANGGQFRVGGTGVGRDTTPVAFRAERGERVTVETKKQQRANDNRAQAANINVPVDITNVLDPQGIVDTAYDTDYGRRKFVNMIKINRDEVREILGSY